MGVANQMLQTPFHALDEMGRRVLGNGFQKKAAFKTGGVGVFAKDNAIPVGQQRG
jgi:hypothetical protein